MTQWDELPLKVKTLFAEPSTICQEDVLKLVKEVWREAYKIGFAAGKTHEQS